MNTQLDILSIACIIAGLVALLATMVYLGVVVDAYSELSELV